MLGPDPGDLVPLTTGAQIPSSDLVREWYFQLANAMIKHPEFTIYELACKLGRKAAWVATIKNSDMFKEFYKQHYNQTVLGIARKTETMVELAIDRIIDRIADVGGEVLPLDSLHEIVDRGSKRLGFGSAPSTNLAVHVGVAVGRGDLEEARNRMKEQFGVVAEKHQADAPKVIGPISPQAQISPATSLPEPQPALDGEILE